MEELAPLAIIIGVGLCVFLWFANASKKRLIEELERRERNALNRRSEDISRFDKEKEDLEDRERNAARQHAELVSRFSKEETKLIESKAELDRQLKNSGKRQKGLITLIQEKNKHFPWLVTALSDYQWYLGKLDEETLRQKKRPAPKAADAVRNATRRAVEAERGFRHLKYRIDFYEKYFPWITDVTGDTLEEFLNASEQVSQATSVAAHDDPVKRRLSQQEYDALSPTDRNQLALDRWKKNKKTNWEIGRLYERFVGYTYEARGYRVEYFGAIHGFDDLWRDVVARKGEEICIVQCKYWSKEKTIHEKHIFQLFGTVVEFIARENIKGPSMPLFGTFTKLADIRPVFVTSTSLSERAKEFARLLDVEVRESERLGDYPLIKCNISKRSQEKLYHLPFDQMYDRTVIEPECGEFYAWTTTEAEQRGFRRAFRWRPEKGD